MMSSTAAAPSLSISSPSTSEQNRTTGSGKSRGLAAASGSRGYHQSDTRTRCNICYQTFGDKASLHKHWKSHTHALSPASSTGWKNGEECGLIAGGGEISKEDDGGESRLIIDLDSTVTTGSAPESGSALTSSPPPTRSSTLSPVLTFRQQASTNGQHGFQHRAPTLTTGMIAPTNHQQISSSQTGEHFLQANANMAASGLLELAQQFQLHQQLQQQQSIGVTVNNTRAPTPRMQQPAGIPAPVVPSQQPTPNAAVTNPYLLSASALSPYTAQQFLLARAAAAGQANQAQLFLPNAAAAQTAAALPYQYLMNAAAAGFSPFCFNDPTALANAMAVAAASGTPPNPNMVAAAMANAGLLVPQTALASAAQLFGAGGGASAAAGIRIQGSSNVSTPAAATCNEIMGIGTQQKPPAVNAVFDNSSRRVSAPDIKHVVQRQQQHLLKADLLLQHHDHGQSGIAISNTGKNAVPPPQQQAAPQSAALSREAVSEHIKRLISENEAIVEPPPALLKRRSYTKCHQGSASLDVSLLAAGSISSANSPGGGIAGMRPPFGRSNRSQSLIDPPAIAAAAQTKYHHQNLVQLAALKTDETASVASTPSPGTGPDSGKNTCHYCNITYRNAASLKAHEFRCANRVENSSSIESQDSQSTAMLSPPGVSAQTRSDQISTPVSTSKHAGVNNGSGSGENKHPLKKRILAAAELDAQKSGSNSNLTATGTVRSPDMEKSIGGAITATGQLAVDDTSPSTSTLVSPSNASKTDPSKQISPESKSADQPIVSAPPRRVSIGQQQSPSIAQQSTLSIVASPHLQILPTISLSPAEQSGRFHPYRLTFRVRDQHSGDVSIASKSPLDRVKPHQVTQPTFCLQRKPPAVFSSIVAPESKESMHAVWPQLSVAPLDAKLNIMMMGSCDVRAKWTGINYSTATANLNSMKITDSTYWEHSKRIQRLAAAAVGAAGVNFPVIAGVKLAGSNVRASTAGAMAPGSNCPKRVVAPGVNCPEPNSSETAPVEDGKNMEEVEMEDTDGLKPNQPMAPAVTSSRQRLKDILISGGSAGAFGSNGQSRKVVVCNGGYKTNEAYTYVRGRGRGRYVCERCGIRCKKPSMLKKHIRTHLNVRPYSCPQCMFSFKTKGNLTKHLKSQAHSKKLASLNSNADGAGDVGVENREPDSDESNRYENESEDDTEEHDDNDGYSTEDDVDENDRCPLRDGEYCTAELRRRRYSYKNIWTNVKDGCYPQRNIRTPPPSPSNNSQSCVNYTELFDRCDTAPPALNSELAISRPFDGQEMNGVKTAESGQTLSNESQNDADQSKLAAIASLSTPSDSENEPGIPSTSSALEQPYFFNEGKCKCEICGQEFIKIGLLRLHMNVHYFGQSGRRYEYKCTFCNSSFRSKSLLQKHTQTAHQKQIQQQNSSSEKLAEVSTMENDQIDNQRRSISIDDPADQSMEKLQLSPGTSASSNPRPFECADCHIAFRIHGHLSKHLRSKLHITKLENMGKLPIGLFARLEDAGTQYIAEIDTSDCVNSLRSLRKLADQFDMLGDFGDSSPKKSKIDDKSEPVVSLACTEQMPPISPSPVVVVPTQSLAKMVEVSKFATETKSVNGLTKSIMAADVWIPPTMDKLEKESVSIVGKSEMNEDGQQKSAEIQKSEASKLIKSPISSNTLPPGSMTQSLCRICHVGFSSPIELDIHLQADHVLMRDGKDFRCPRQNCDTVYPNQESLRQHLASHFYGRLEDNHAASMAGTESANGSDVSKSTVAALSRKLGGTSSLVNGDGVEATNQMEKSRKKMKTHLVKLSSIPEAPANSSQTAANDHQNSNSSSSRMGPGGLGSTDTSPISVCGAGMDSDASRASINSSHSASPSADSPATMDGVQSGGGRCSSGRQSAKRKSLDDATPNIPKRIAPAGMLDPQQLIQLQLQQQAAFSGTPPMNGFYQRLPTASIPSQSPVIFQSNTAAGAMTPNSINGWSPSPLYQQFPVARQQLSPPQQFYLGPPTGHPSMAPFIGLQNPFASTAALAQQHAAAKLLAANGVAAAPFWNGPGAALAASQLLGASTTSSETAAAFQAAAGLSSLNDAATAAALGFFLPPQACILCGKQFANNAQLQEHLLSHSLSRPFVCEHCDAGFTTEQALQSHRPCRQQRIDA